ncbi:hypothetical protein EXIGLDRAFT_779034 [Exidia glandulosa HHB12029]|uniref:Yeast cell wall synthesis Kre9/Knh1-like N-terminal domain-containing protein n=1 Tax=Exidia glandulosa HHB12029 TaxID=1314781 RepID=A0A165ZET5_EXIGL|nr:hypothetical protein EXIGLDRAFT_779034 [Exidia glandulosa HHB12029]
MLPVVALIAAFPAAFVRGLTLNQPSVWNDSDFNTLTWSTAPGDPTTFSVDLFNNQSFPQGLTILDTVKTADGQIKFNLPGVPEGGNYTIVAHPVGNPGDVLFSSGTFKIADSRTPNSTAQSSTTSGSGTATVATPTAGTSQTFGNGVPQAPSAAPTFPGTDPTDGTGAALALRPTFAAAAGVLGLALACML